MENNYGFERWEPSEEELEEILQKHERYWDSDHNCGEMAKLRKLELPGGYLYERNLKGADIRWSNLSEVVLVKADLSDALLRGSDLSDAEFYGATLTRADLNDSDVSNADFKDTDLSQSILFHISGEEPEFRRSNLSNADLSGAFLPRADFSDAILNNANLERIVLPESCLDRSDLSEAILSNANFTNSSLSHANLGSADLHGVNLKDANLFNASLKDCDLTDATFHGAYMRNSNLKSTSGLQTEALARANISNAKLPEEVSQFEGLDTVEAASESARKLFIALGLACAYAALAISTNTSGVGTLTLPFINVDIGVFGFHVVTPLLLALSFGYFHLQMQRVWEEMSRLPAVFPDGKAIDQKIHPWLVTGLARAHVPFLRDNPVPLFPLQKLVVIVLAWGTVPLTQAYFVGSFVKQFPEHALLSGLGAALVAATLGGAVVSYRTAKAHLRGEYEGPFRLFANENEDVRRCPDWQTVFWAAEWTLATFALWIWWTFVYLGH